MRSECLADQIDITYYPHQHFVHLFRLIAKFNLSLTRLARETLANKWRGQVNKKMLV
jgi:hypothetical protein